MASLECISVSYWMPVCSLIVLVLCWSVLRFPDISNMIKMQEAFSLEFIILAITIFNYSLASIDYRHTCQIILLLLLAWLNFHTFFCVGTWFCRSGIICNDSRKVQAISMQCGSPTPSFTLECYNKREIWIPYNLIFRARLGEIDT